MSNTFYDYVHSTFNVLEERIRTFIENYNPTNLTIPGYFHANGNTTLGSDSCNDLTVNARTTFNAEVEAGCVRMNNLTVVDDTTLGQCGGSDRLTVHSSARFNKCAEFKESFRVEGNAHFGEDCSNEVCCSGSVKAKHFEIPTDNSNSFKVGCTDMILYVENCGDINIFCEYNNSVIVVIKNRSDTCRTITYDKDGCDTHTQHPCTTFTYLKTSQCGFVRVDRSDEENNQNPP